MKNKTSLMVLKNIYVFLVLLFLYFPLMVVCVSHLMTANQPQHGRDLLLIGIISFLIMKV